jgi:hypothetical protein
MFLMALQVIEIIANDWLVIADQSQLGIEDPACFQLAQLHSDAMDYPKTGNPVNVYGLPRIKFPKPDWSAPETVEPDPVNYYRSQSAIGVLCRAINLDHHNPSLPSDPLDNSAAPVGDVNLLHAVRQRVLQYIQPDDTTPNALIEGAFLWFSDELLHVASECSLSNRHSRPLHEAEMLVGTITQKTSEPRMREGNISKMREYTDGLVRRVRWMLEGDDDKLPEDYLRDAWSAWNLTFDEGRRKRFGARAFGWVALGGVLDALQMLEDTKMSEN